MLRASSLYRFIYIPTRRLPRTAPRYSFFRHLSVLPEENDDRHSIALLPPMPLPVTYTPLPSILKAIENKNTVNKSPKSLLLECYQKVYGGSISLSSNFEIRKKGDGKRWTSIFTCPRTKKDFPSGIFGENYEVDEEGVVWYFEEKLAEHAAAQMALNDLYPELSKESSSIWQTEEKGSPKQVVDPKILHHNYFRDQTKFNTWSKGVDGVTRWTSVFTCPRTNKESPSGMFGENYEVDEEGVVWYVKKKLAEQAAAQVAWTDTFVEIPENSQSLLQEKEPVLSPKHLLNNYFRNQIKFNTWSKLGVDGITRWTSVFTCPRINKELPSGVFGENYEVDEEGVVWYVEKKLAEQAAAQRALNDLYSEHSEKSVSFWHTEGKESPKQVFHPINLLRNCFIDQIKLNTWSKLGEDKVARWTSVFTCPGTNKEFPSGMFGENYEVDEGVVWYVEKKLAEHSAAQTVLNELYPEHSEKSVGFWKQEKENIENLFHRYFDKFNTWSKLGVDEVTRWTSVFSCPRTNKEFPSGMLGENYEVDEEGVVWYVEKNLAEQAAAQTVLNEEFTEHSEKIVNFWQKNPSQSINWQKKRLWEDKTLEDVNDNFLPAEENHLEEKNKDLSLYSSVRYVSNDISADEDKTLEDVNDNFLPAEENHLEEKNKEILSLYSSIRYVSNDISADENVPSIQEEKGEYFIRHIPTTSPTELILKAWADTDANLQENESKNVDPFLTESERNQSFDEMLDSINKANHALSWFQRLKETSKEISTKSCISVLNALASTPYHWQEDNFSSDKLHLTPIKSLSDVEKVASDIMKEMTLSNVESYNAYIRCIRRESPDHVAMAAEEVFNKMKDSNILPNVETFNIMLSLWNHDSRKTKEWFAKMQEIGIRPNRDTFLNSLKSLAKDDGGFDTALAKWYICSMEREGNMLPNIDVYNAPLKHDKWNDYDHLSIGEGGEFNPFPFEEQEQSIADRTTSKQVSKRYKSALQYEEWLLDLEQNRNISPNTHTYESVIQAWVRTNTLEGLVKAEEWAMSIISLYQQLEKKSVKPTLATFKPIIMAWALCGMEIGPERVEAWIEKLVDIGEDTPEVRPDAYVMTIAVVAWWRYQSLLYEGQSTQHIDETIVLCANKCTEWMNHILSSSSSDISCYVPVFHKVMDSWAKIPSHHPLKINSVVDVIQRLNTILDESGSEMTRNQGIPFQEIYSLALWNLQNSTIPEKENRNGFELHFPTVESMIYRSNSLYSQQQMHPAKESQGQKISPTFSKHTLEGFYIALLQGCKLHLSTKTHRKGDAVRIAMHVLEKISPTSTSYESSKDYTNIYLKIIECLGDATDEEYRENVMKRVYKNMMQSASKGGINVQKCLNKISEQGISELVLKKWSLSHENKTRSNFGVNSSDRGVE